MQWVTQWTQTSSNTHHRPLPSHCIPDGTVAGPSTVEITMQSVPYEFKSAGPLCCHIRFICTKSINTVLLCMRVCVCVFDYVQCIYVYIQRAGNLYCSIAQLKRKWLINKYVWPHTHPPPACICRIRPVNSGCSTNYDAVSEYIHSIGSEMSTEKYCKLIVVLVVIRSVARRVHGVH